MSDLYQSLSPSKGECKYHVVWVSRRRRKVVFGKLRRQLGKSSMLWHGRKHARFSKAI